MQTAFEEAGGRFLPDGRWIAYQSNESGRTEVYVQPFPGPGRNWQISTESGGTCLRSGAATGERFSTLGRTTA